MRLEPWLNRAWVGLLVWIGLGLTVYLGWLVGELTVSWSAHAAVVLVPFLAWQAKARAWRRVGLSALGALVGLLPWAPQLGDPKAAAPMPGQPTLRVMVANTYYAPPRLEDLTADLDASKTAIVTLVEPPTQLPHHLEATGRWRTLTAHLPGNKNNIALMARRGVEGLEVVTATAAVRDYTPSVPLAAELRFFGAPLHVLAAHPPAPTEPAQQAERLRLVPDLGASLQAPGILMADLNLTRASPLWAGLMKAGLRRSKFDLPASWPSLLGPLGVSIDHVLAKGDVALGAPRPVWLTLSDHRAVVVEVALPQARMKR